jgi:hypothetical protein
VEAFVDDVKLGGYRIQVRPGRTLSLSFSSREVAARGRAEAGSPAAAPIREAARDHLEICRKTLAVAKELKASRSERVQWAEKMFKQGYESRGALAEERQRLLEAERDVLIAEGAVRDAERALAVESTAPETAPNGNQ